MAPANLPRAGGVEGVALEFGHMSDLVIPWQARFLRGLRKPDVRTAALSVARSNGKSWLAARLAADYLRDGAPDSECVIVASSYTQATVIFRYVAAMVEDAGEDLADRSLWQYQDSTTTALIRNRSTGRAVRALGCDPRRAHGRKFGVALLDEPAQWPPGTRDGMLAAIRTERARSRALRSWPWERAPTIRCTGLANGSGRGRLCAAPRGQAGRSAVPDAHDPPGESRL